MTLLPAAEALLTVIDRWLTDGAWKHFVVDVIRVGLIDFLAVRRIICIISHDRVRFLHL